MYPQLWANSGVSFPELVDKLVQFAIEKESSPEKNEVALNN